jgi:hypothetical protein
LKEKEEKSFHQYSTIPGIRENIKNAGKRVIEEIYLLLSKSNSPFDLDRRR